MIARVPDTKGAMQRADDDIVDDGECREGFDQLKRAADAQTADRVRLAACQLDPVKPDAAGIGAEEVAKAYLEFLYSPAGQKLAAKHFFRPVDEAAADPADLARFPKLDLVSIDTNFGGWAAAQKKHFADGGVFDEIYRPTN